MSIYKTILFDLDGTLTDSAQGVTNSIRYALSKFDITEDDPKKLLRFIGSGLDDSFRDIYSFSDQQASDAVDYYREYFREIGINEHTIYPGIKDLLSDLSEQGCRLCTATLKPKIFTEIILKHYNIFDLFEVIGAPELDEKRINKSVIIKRVLEKLSDVRLSETVMVGDRDHDIEGAKENGITGIAVRWGYGSEEEIRNSNPDYIAGNVQGLRDILMY
ncbi:HAD-IA family hydrolase [bacterium]|nr:HAD-IA family hydrolase [bacterium]